MTKTATIRARVEPQLKLRAESVLTKLGMNPTTAITMFYRQIVTRRGLPFDIKLPNAVTRQAMQDAREERDLVRGESVDDLISLLDAD